MSAPVQGELWSSDPQGWAEVAEGRIQPLYERVLERLQPLSGTRLLDAGCGSGLFAELAARGGADVIGLDAAPGLVEYARRRRPAAGYVVGDLERMPFADAPSTSSPRSTPCSTPPSRAARSPRSRA